MVNDGASACITNDKNDFIWTPKTISRKVNGINRQAQATNKGTVRGLIEDDEGVIRVFTINGAYLVPTAQQGSFHLNTWLNKLKITTQD